MLLVTRILAAAPDIIKADKHDAAWNILLRMPLQIVMKEKIVEGRVSW